MKRLFERLSCPILHLVDDIDNPTSQAALLGWLEDRKIREYDIDERSALKLVSEEWPSAISAYLQTLNCPVKLWEPQTGEKIPLSNRRALQWLVSYAISLDFADSIDEDKEDDAKGGMDVDDVPVSVSTDMQALLDLGAPFGLKLNPDESIAGKCI